MAGHQSAVLHPLYGMTCLYRLEYVEIGALCRRPGLRYYVQQLSYLSATNDPQYARVPTGEIKLPDMRLHHNCVVVKEVVGQRAFNQACFAGLPCLVKSQWPLMTERITEMIKCNGPRGKGLGCGRLGKWEGGRHRSRWEI